jgi:hypothetical protein
MMRGPFRSEGLSSHSQGSSIDPAPGDGALRSFLEL